MLVVQFCKSSVEPFRDLAQDPVSSALSLLIQEWHKR